MPSGGNPRQRFERFEKKCRFRHSEYWFIPQNSLKIHRIWNGFLMMTCNLQGDLFLKRCAVFFPPYIAIRFFKARPVSSKRLLVLEFIQRHCHNLMLRINFGLTWPLDLVERLHGMADLDSRHIASTPQPRDVTSDVRVTQVNMNVNILTPPTQWRNVRCACDAS